MKRIISTALLFALMPLHGCKAQLAVKKSVVGTVVQEYMYSNTYNKYCLGSSLLILEKDTLFFFPNRTTNSIVINSNQNLRKALGDPNDYVVADIDSIPQFDLRDNKYNYHKYSRQGWIVESEQFYSSRMSRSVFTSFQLTGEIIIYSDSRYLESKKVETDEDCYCGKSDFTRFITRKFAVLGSAEKLDKITPQRATELGLIPLKINMINLFYCE